MFCSTLLKGEAMYNASGASDMSSFCLNRLCSSSEYTLHCIPFFIKRVHGTWLGSYNIVRARVMLILLRVHPNYHAGIVKSFV